MAQHWQTKALLDFLGCSKFLVRKFGKVGPAEPAQKTGKQRQTNNQRVFLEKEISHLRRSNDLRVVTTEFLDRGDLFQAIDSAFIKNLASFDALAMGFVFELVDNRRLRRLLVLLKHLGKRFFRLLVCRQFHLEKLDLCMDIVVILD